VKWEKNRTVYFDGGSPMMSTLDAYKWLRYADEYKKGTYGETPEIDPLMYYPDKKYKPKYVPMISWLIAKLSFIGGGDLHKTGVLMIPFLASLLVIPIGLYLFRCGLGIAGLGAAMTGSLGYMYLLRSSVGRVDTDLLNLFFPFLASFLLLMAGTVESKIKTYVSSALAGLTMLLFYWWYAHPGMTVVYFVVLVVFLLISKKDLKTIGIASLLFFIFSGPPTFYAGLLNVLGFLKVYIIGGKTIEAGFPDIYKTIIEARHVSTAVSLRYNFGTAGFLVGKTGMLDILTGVGLAGALAAFVFNYKKMLPLVPVFLLGFASFKGASRFTMYMSPLAGLGLGYILYVFGYVLVEKVKVKRFIAEALTASILLCGLLMIFSKTSFSYVPRPSISKDVYKEISGLKDKLPPDSVVLSWWDYCLAIEERTGFATYHNGMSQRTPKTYFIAKALTGMSQKELRNITAFIHNEGNEKIQQMLDSGEKVDDIINKVKRYDKKIEGKRAFLVITADMIRKFQPIASIGNWDFDTGKGHGGAYRGIKCSGVKNGVLICGKDRIDMKKGLINGSVRLAGMVDVNNGQIKSEQTYRSGEGAFLQIVRQGNRVLGIYILEREVFFSNMNRLFFIGKSDTPDIKEVYTKLPQIRVYEIR